VSLKKNNFFAEPEMGGAKFENWVEALQQFAPSLRHSKLALEHAEDEFIWRADFASANGLSVCRSQANAGYSLDYTGPEHDVLGLVFPIAGGFEASIGARSTIVSQGTVLIDAVQASPLRRWRIHNGRGVTLKFDQALATNILATIYDGVTLRDLELHALLDLSTPAGEAVYLIAQTIVSGMYGERILDRSPKAAALLAEAALRLVFEHASHKFSHLPPRKLIDMTPRNIRAAIDFMHANLHHPLTVTEIAGAAGVSVRSLQAGFQQFQDTTPAAYLRRIRLEAVHKELSLPVNVLPVNEVALKWGFTHMGRFAAQYRTAYGRHPSETAKAARGMAN
jgi:AraC-like DNA-binding protein